MFRITRHKRGTLLWSVLALCAQAARAQQAAAPAQAPADSTFHAQATYILQMHPGIDSPYSGMNSLDPNQESKHTISLTLFLGHSLWDGAGLYFDPEVTQGQGLSDTVGIADFPNGEGSRASSTTPGFSSARW